MLRVFPIKVAHNENSYARIGSKFYPAAADGFELAPMYTGDVRSTVSWPRANLMWGEDKFGRWGVDPGKGLIKRPQRCRDTYWSSVPAIVRNSFARKP